MEQVTLEVKERQVSQKGANKALRRSGHVPAVVYHKHEDSKTVSLHEKTFRKLLQTEAGRNVLINIAIEGAKDKSKPAVISEIQYDPISGSMLHVDFHQVSLDEKIKVMVPIRETGDEPIGVKNDGGLLESPTREIEVECLPTNMPEHIDVNVSGLGINDAVHARDLILPEGIVLHSDPDAVIAIVVKHEVEEEAPADEEAEGDGQPEVITEKKEEEKASE